MTRDTQRPFSSFEADMGELMGVVLRGSATYRRTWTPRVDVYETSSEFLVVADLGGIPPAAVTVEIDDSEVKISGSRTIPLPENETGRAYALQLEIPAGPFERRLTLPGRVDTEKSVAGFVNGMLVIRFPKSARRRRKVEVSGE